MKYLLTPHCIVCKRKGAAIATIGGVVVRIHTDCAITCARLTTTKAAAA